MNILILGGGGREHALAWAVKQNPKCDRLIVAPGNAGIALLAECADIDILDGDAVAIFAAENAVDFVIIGPEAPLAAGVADRLRGAGLAVFGPSAAAAQLEASKSFTKAICDAAGAPTAAYARFTETAAAHAYVTAQGAPIVIKADGLAAGKGVVVAMDVAEAHAAIDQMLGGTQSHGARVVIEEFMAGEEASFIVLCDGKNVATLATSQDHKRVGEGDTGPNTGGMGAYSPAPVVTPNVHARVMQDIILPTVAGMAKDGVPFTGFLYAGLMIDAQGQPRTVEFNCRLGDPEAQVILMRLKSDLLELLLHATDGTLDDVELQWDRRSALGVVVAAAGYPTAPRSGDVVTALPSQNADLQVFHAGTRLDNGQTVVSGGRVLCVTALADSVRLAQQRALEAVRQVQFNGAHWRNDIGHRAIKH